MKTKSNKTYKNLSPVEKKQHTKSSLAWFLEVGFHYGTITETDALRLSGVDKVTFYRWLNGKACAPAGTLELIRMYAFGEPPAAQSQAWRGFRFQNDRLITEDGRALSPADLKAVFFWKQLALQACATRDKPIIYDQLRVIYA